MTDLVAVACKMPVELRDRLQDRARGVGKTASALVLMAVQTMLAGVGDAQVGDADPRIASLEAEVKRLRALANQSVVQAVASKAIGHHAAGPVLDPKVTARGTVTPRFRAGSEGEKALKSGR